MLRHPSARSLGIIALLGGIVLAACGTYLGSLDQGSGWDSLWMAPVRLCFLFVVGLWFYSVRDRPPRPPLGWLPLSAIMTGAMLLPIIPEVRGVKLNGLDESACVILLFPAILIAGAHSAAGRGMLGLCKASGRTSYPLYITHFPLLYVWMNFVARGDPTQGQLLGFGLALIRSSWRSPGRPFSGDDANDPPAVTREPSSALQLRPLVHLAAETSRSLLSECRFDSSASRQLDEHARPPGDVSCCRLR